MHQPAAMLAHSIFLYINPGTQQRADRTSSPPYRPRPRLEIAITTMTRSKAVGFQPGYARARSRSRTGRSGRGSCVCAPTNPMRKKLGADSLHRAFLQTHLRVFRGGRVFSCQEARQKVAHRWLVRDRVIGFLGHVAFI